MLFQFGVNLGRYGDEFQMHKHDGWPDLYKACNLRESCEAVSLQKRAKNKKKGQKKQEETEETTLSVGENNDEASTTASNGQFFLEIMLFYGIITSFFLRGFLSFYEVFFLRSSSDSHNYIK